MSWQPCEDPKLGDARSCDAIETVIVPRAKDLGGFEVRRALPSPRRQMIGPFIFFDQMGPSEFILGEGIDVRPHPHIGLSTVTYLFRGEIMHRDSLGVAQPIRPGEVNWMTAGRGIVHSERTGLAERERGAKLFGIQSWLALPDGREEIDPGFAHYPASDLPLIEADGADIRLIAGSLFGETSPVRTHSDLFYAEVVLRPGARMALEPGHVERGVYVAEGAVEVAPGRFEAGRLLVLREGDQIVIEASRHARVMLLGGEPMEGPRYIWWNFVSSSKERIDQAKADWKAGRFEPVPGETEFIPLPET